MATVAINPSSLPTRLSPATRLVRAARMNPLATIGTMLVMLFAVLAVFAPLIAPHDPAAIDLPSRLAPPSATHWFGTDELGRDILSRIVFGARISMLVGTSVVAFALLLGLVVGSIAGYYGGRVDRFVNVVVMNAFLSFPGILLAIAFVAFLGPGILNLILALSIGGWVGYARLVRGQVLRAREFEYVQAARALGAKTPRILVRHVIPAAIPAIVVQATLGMAGATIGEAALSFLGLGVQPPTPSFGSMIADSRKYLINAWWIATIPGIFLAVALTSINLMGSALEKARNRIYGGL